jgi:outer membrane lipoprotein LolB
MRKTLCLVAGLTSIFLMACTKVDKQVPMQNSNYTVLRGLKIENAVTDAEASMRSNDFRLLAIRGYTLDVPGTSEDIQSIKATYGIREIEGTSDAIDGSEHERLIENARRYAMVYNKTIIANARP